MPLNNYFNIAKLQIISEGKNAITVQYSCIETIKIEALSSSSLTKNKELFHHVKPEIIFKKNYNLQGKDLE